MTDIQFYHLTSTPLERALPKLLEKAAAGKFRTLVLAASEEKAEWLNNILWTYDPDSFLPHGTSKDGPAAAHPIFITAGDEQHDYVPDLLVVTDGSELNFDANLKRVLDIFDGSDEESVARARARWKSYQGSGHAVTYIKQTASGSWEKQA